MSDILVVTSKVKAKIKESELRTSQEFIDELSKRVELQIEAAVTRARAANRKTVMVEDLS